MSSVLDDRNIAPVPHPGLADVRLVLLPVTGIHGVLDGGWWPRTHVLSRELPAVLTAVQNAFGVVVTRISMSTTIWDATPETVDVGDRVVHLAWFRARDAHTIRLLSAGAWHLDLLVIPPDTPAHDADGALALVGQGHAIGALHAILTAVPQRTGSARCA